MIQLNFMDLSEEAKERLLLRAKKDVEQQFGLAIEQHAKNGFSNYDEMINTEAQRKLYDYQYVFKV